ncbi:hypothetical protein SMKI_08G1990 [Saccharomyces mikatae IFO 1815]|uniref:GYF domain-containing protein n=1 Tax=Saccharomyces mikatae IFO 1815 TaxID=226126 RepID=A0AA35J145_SACMI|nr:uncharacterized protein SMKI_08G1990 [Saccharomyces mikatae IFO 1815]CAI4039531.1 hypothetical protein SMKI_08G1990 [Saccharomyces mikatae IFO 1815]
MGYTQGWNTSKLKRKGDQFTDDEELHDGPYHRDKRYRNGKLNTAEYDSDSSVESYTDDENNGRGMDAKINEVDEKKDEDMFSSDNYKHSEGHEKLKKSNMKLLDIAEFKKENLVGLDYTIENSETEKEEEGVNIEPFNIDDEMEHGVFDRDGNYIKTEINAENESQNNEEWMNDVIKTEDVNRLEKKQNVKAGNSRHYMVHEALILLKFFLADDKETALKSLGRLNKLRKKAITEQEKSLRYVIHGIKLLSDLINILENKGFSEVYDFDRRKVEDAIEEEIFDESSRIDNHKTKLWDFKWLGKLDEKHGQYTNYEMSYWQKTYFHDNVVVKFQSEPDEDQNWIHVSCLRFM